MTSKARKWREPGYQYNPENEVTLTLYMPDIGGPLAADQLLCGNCYARSADDGDGWERTEYGDLCPECAYDDVAHAGVETSGVAAIEELFRLVQKK